MGPLLKIFGSWKFSISQILATDVFRVWDWCRRFGTKCLSGMPDAFFHLLWFRIFWSFFGVILEEVPGDFSHPALLMLGCCCRPFVWGFWPYFRLKIRHRGLLRMILIVFGKGLVFLRVLSWSWVASQFWSQLNNYWSRTDLSDEHSFVIARPKLGKCCNLGFGLLSGF